MRFLIFRRFIYGKGTLLAEPERLIQVHVFNASFSPASIPRDQIKKTFVKSSGPGGQNVNKVSTKADCRFVLSAATWIPIFVREKLAVSLKNRLNKRGEVSFSSDRHRTQLSNLEDCYNKIYESIVAAAHLPKETSEDKKLKVLEHKAVMKERALFRGKKLSDKKSQRRSDA